MTDYLEALAITKILKGEVNPTTFDMIEPEVFTVHRAAVEWIIAYYSQHQALPSEQLVQKIFFTWNPADGTDEFGEIMEALTTAAMKTWLERDLAQSIDILYDQGPRAASSFISGQLLRYGKNSPDIHNLVDLRDRYNAYRKRREARESGAGIGIPTGFPTLNRWTNGGLQNGNYYLILGDTNVGKTWFSLRLAVEAWKAGYVVLYVSLEGGGDEPGYRFDSLVGHLSNSRLFGGYTELGEYEAYLTGLQGRTNPFWLAVQGARAEYTPGALWTQVAAKHPDIIFVDYLTLMTMEGEDAEDWRIASHLSRTLASGFANRLNIPVVANTQGTRGIHGKSSLSLDDIAIAYAIVRPADMVVGLSPIQGGLKVELLKGRHVKMVDEENKRAKFYCCTKFDVGEITEDDSVLV